MIDLSKYEKIEGREALRRLLDGENIYVDENTFVHLPIYNDLQRVDIVNGKPMSEDDWISITEFIEHEWFIKKPFDVRQAMRDKPDEWVGVYQENDGSLYKVGFDTNRFLAVETELESEASVTYDFPNVRGTYPEDLERCIPIEDVSVNVNK